jgi:hypothetical protein
MERGGFLAVEVLYRHNVLWSRAQLFKHFVRGRRELGFASLENSKAIREDLEHYCKYVGSISREKD